MFELNDESAGAEPTASMRSSTITGLAAPLPIANLDTDQIMPKQFLRGIDKSGLDKGLLFDLRCHPDGRPRENFVLNEPAYAGASILVGGANFGCGSSREHAVWGLLQYGIRAIIAPSFAEIFYSNAMNNRLMLAALPEPIVQGIMDDAADPATANVTIDVERGLVKSHGQSSTFSISERHRQMFLQGLDVIGASLTHAGKIEAFSQHHWQRKPWLKDIASRTVARLA